MVEIAENDTCCDIGRIKQRNLMPQRVSGLKWLKSIIDYDKEAKNSNEFFETIKSDLFNNEV